MTKGSWREFDDSLTQLGKNSFKSKLYNKALLEVRVQKVKAGKGGKTVTVISGLGIDSKQAKSYLNTLKSLCGTGGTFKESLIELQGDQVNVALQFLGKEGYRPKRIGS